MNQKGWKLTVIFGMLILAFGLVLTGCGATKQDLQRVEAMAQQALDNSEAAKASCTNDAQNAQNAAVRAENAAARAENAAVAAEQSADKAEAMANKAEAIFMQKMKK